MHSDSTTLTEARDWLRTRAAAGERCPCCRQFVKVYRRKLNSGMAAWLIRFYRVTRHAPQSFHHFKSVPFGSGDYSLLRHWGLIEPNPAENTAGQWRVSANGIAFVRGELRMGSHAVIYDDRCLRIDGDSIGIRVALGKRFDYAELMAERPQSNEPE